MIRLRIKLLEGEPMIRTAQTFEVDAHAAVAEIKVQLGAIQPKLLLCFASTSQDPAELVRVLHAAYPGAALWGGTTAGELCTGKMSKGSVSVMAFGAHVVERTAIALLGNVDKNRDLEPAIASLERQLGVKLETLDPDSHVGLIITDGLSGAEEQLLEALSARTEIPFLGGSAGDDLKFEATHVFQNGAANPHAACLLLLTLPRGYEILKTQSFRETGKFLEATAVDVAKRQILAFDGHPAVYAYAEAVGATPDVIQDRFVSNPIARLVGNEPYIRSPRNIDGTALHMYCGVNQGESLAVMEATDILADTKAALTPFLGGASQAQGVVDFHCILRSLELQSRGQTGEYMALFGDVPVAGFCTYGEACSTHVNQTSTMLVFK